MAGGQINKIKDSLDKNDYLFLISLIRNLSFRWDKISRDANLLQSLTLSAFNINPLLTSKRGIFVAWIDQEENILECRGFIFPERILLLNALHAGGLGASALISNSSLKSKLTKIEIHLVSKIKIIRGFEEIEIGKDGLILTVSENLGSIQLPHVAVRENLDQIGFYQRGIEKIKSKDIDLKKLKILTFTTETFRETKAKNFILE